MRVLMDMADLRASEEDDYLDSVAGRLKDADMADE